MKTTKEAPKFEKKTIFSFEKVSGTNCSTSLDPPPTTDPTSPSPLTTTHLAADH